jgi:hypothetical protein
VDQLEKSTSALQNTIDHLEHRLEMANCEKIDAEEQLFNLQSQRSPFDPKPPKLQMPAHAPPAIPSDRQNSHMSMSTVFSSDSPINHVNEQQEPSTIAAFVSHIERIQEQLKQKEALNTELEEGNARLRDSYDQLGRDYRELTLKSDIQGQLLNKSKQSDVYVYLFCGVLIIV